MVNTILANAIENRFDFRCTYLDFFYPFCEAKGYEDVESNPDVTDKMYDELETEFFKTFPKAKTADFEQKVWKFIENGIKEIMAETVEKGE